MVCNFFLVLFYFWFDLDPRTRRSMYHVKHNMQTVHCYYHCRYRTDHHRPWQENHSSSILQGIRVYEGRATRILIYKSPLPQYLRALYLRIHIWGTMIYISWVWVFITRVWISEVRILKKIMVVVGMPVTS